MIYKLQLVEESSGSSGVYHMYYQSRHSSTAVVVEFFSYMGLFDDNAGASLESLHSLLH